MHTLTNLATRHAEGWAALMGHAAWQGTVVGLVALVIVALGRRRASPLRYWILVLALIKFAMPPMAAAPTGLFSLVRVSDRSVSPVDRNAALVPTQPIEIPRELPSGAADDVASSQPISQQQVRSTNRFGGENASEPLATPHVSATATPPLSLLALLMVVHLIGAVLVLALFALRSIRLQIAWRRMDRPDSTLVDLVRQTTREMGLGRIPDVRLSRGDGVPYSAGTIHPTVVLPRALARQLSRDELHIIVCHELAHHRRGDLWFNLLQVAIEAVWWFHPVVWLLNRAIRGVREECCDDLLLARRFVTDEPYCTTLLRVAQRSSRRFYATPAAVSIADGLHPLTGRIRRIMDESLPRCERPGAWPIAVLCVAAAAVLPGVGAAPAQRPVTVPAAAGKVEPMPAPDLDDDTGPAVGGRIVDDQNRPVAGARVVLSVARQQTKQERLKLPQTEFETTTAADGTWSIASLPVAAELSGMQVSHTDYAALQRFALAVDAMRELRASSYERMLRKGVPVFGRVTNEKGAPIAEATVALGQYFNNFNEPSIATTSADGQYRFEHCREGDSLLTVFKAGLAPQMRTIEVGKLDGRTNIQLLPGRTLQIRVFDKSGDPIEGAAVVPFKWPDTVNLTQLHNFGKTDANGNWTWNWAPEHGLPLMVSQTGYMRRLSGSALRPRSDPHEIMLMPELRVRVKVVDDATGQPVPAVRLTLGIGRDPKSQIERWLPPQEMASPGGQYAVRQAEFPWEVCAVRVEAQGYAAMTSRMISADDQEVAIDFRLKAERGHEGIALEADGTPAAGALVLVGSKTSLVNLSDIRIDAVGRKPVIRTDRDGRFLLDAQADDFTVFLAGTTGSASIRRAEFDVAGREPVQIQLTPWARVEGILQSHKQLLADETVALGVPGDSPQFGLNATSRLETRTDANGRFVFYRVPFGGEVVMTHVVTVRTGQGPFLGSGATARFKLAAGEIRTIDLGRNGRTVCGRFQLKDETWAVDWEASIGSLHAMRDPAQNEIHYRPPPRFQIQKDGAFQIDDVPSGSYRISFELLALKAESSLRSRQNGVPVEKKGTSGLVVGTIVVPDASQGEGDQSVDVGTLPVGAVTAPAK